MIIAIGMMEMWEKKKLEKNSNVNEKLNWLPACDLDAMLFITKWAHVNISKCDG